MSPRYRHIAAILIWAAVVPEVEKLHSQELSDTLDYALPEIVVSATRTRISSLDSPSPLVTISRSDIDRLGGVRLSDVMGRIPGMFQRDLGGPGSMKTLTMRGSQASHTVVLLDGIRLNSYQNGLIDAGLVVTDWVDRIEIVRGGQSALYGADAIGGVVNLMPIIPADSLRLTFAASVGSFDTWSARTVATGGIGDLSIAAGLARQKSLGNFEFRQNENGTTVSRIRENSDSELNSGFLRLRHPITTGSAMTLMAEYVAADRGVPGPAVGGMSSPARLTDDQLNTYLNYRIQSRSAGVATVSANYRHSLETYVDTLGILKTNDSYKNIAKGLSLQWTFPLDGTSMAFVTGDVVEATLEGAPLGGIVRRTQHSASGGIELSWKTNAPYIRKISLYPLVRFDSFSDVAGMWSPRIGVNVWLQESGSVQLRGSIGKSFRAPNFNELYWRSGGNPDLTHEEAFQGDAGIRLRMNGLGLHEIDVTYFYISMKNRITGWPPVNLSRTANKGLEVQWQWYLPWTGYRLDIDGTYTDARNKSGVDEGKLLPFVPELVLRGALQVEIDDWLATLRGQFASRQFTTPDNSPALSIASSTVFDAMLEYRLFRINVPLILQFSVYNLLNEEYEFVKGYPMPLRNFRFGIRLNV